MRFRPIAAARLGQCNGGRERALRMFSSNCARHIIRQPDTAFYPGVVKREDFLSQDAHPFQDRQLFIDRAQGKMPICHFCGETQTVAPRIRDCGLRLAAGVVCTDVPENIDFLTQAA